LDYDFAFFFIHIKQSSVCRFVVLSFAGGDVASETELRTEDGSSKRRRNILYASVWIDEFQVYKGLLNVALNAETLCTQPLYGCDRNIIYNNVSVSRTSLAVLSTAFHHQGAEGQQ